MAIKNDTWIRRMALDHRMIEPFVDSQVRSGVISYGLSSYGYDIRVADDFKVFTNIYNTVVDPKNFDPKSFVDIKADERLRIEVLRIDDRIVDVREHLEVVGDADVVAVGRETERDDAR